MMEDKLRKRQIRKELKKLERIFEDLCHNGFIYETLIIRKEMLINELKSLNPKKVDN